MRPSPSSPQQYLEPFRKSALQSANVPFIICTSVCRKLKFIILEKHVIEYVTEIIRSSSSCTAENHDEISVR